jgi:SET family sugar efflux transporter-like MFS transporter
MQRLLLPARTILRHPDFVVALGCSLLLGLAYSFVAPFLSMFGTLEVKMTALRFGVFMTITSLSAIVVSTALARWSDTHFSRRKVLMLGSIAGALGYVGYAFVRDVTWLTIIGATALAVSSVTFSQLFAHARELLAQSDVPPADAPLYINVFRLFFALAWTIGPAAASWVMVWYSYRGMFVTAAIIFLLLLMVVAWFVPEVPRSRARVGVARTQLWETLKRPDLLAYFTGFVLINMCSTIAMMNLPLLVLKNLRGDGHDVGIIYSLSPIFELPFMFYFGMLASKGDQTRILRMGVTFAVLYYTGLYFVQAPWHVYPLQILNAAMVAVNSGVAITFFQNYLPGQAGTATNLFVTAGRIGSTAGYLAFGSLAAALGHRAVFCVCAALSGVTLLLFLLQHQRTRRLATALN